MPLPLSGPISLDMIQTEFGGSNPIGLSEYYRGGSLVPNSSVNASIPTNGAISLGNFYGSAAYLGVVTGTTGYLTYGSGGGNFHVQGIGFNRPSGGATVGSITSGASQSFIGNIIGITSFIRNTSFISSHEFCLSVDETGADDWNSITINNIVLNRVDALQSFDTDPELFEISRTNWTWTIQSSPAGSTIFPAASYFPAAGNTTELVFN